MRVAAHGIRADLPDGWEGAIRREPRVGELRAQSGAATAGERTFPVAHLASFALPAERGDFGSGAVEVMRTGDAFVALVGYGPEEAGTALFQRRGLPERLDPRAFSPRSLQRTVPGQTGLQRFLTAGGRAFCLYVVTGAGDGLRTRVRRVEEVLAGVRLDELGTAGDAQAPR